MDKDVLTAPYTTGSLVAVAKLTGSKLTASLDRLRHAAGFSVAVVLLGSLPVRAMADFILFPAVTGTQRSIDRPTDQLKKYQLLPELDVFYSADRGRFRFLSEFLTSSEEPIDVERLQLGWLTGSETTVWFGRHHSPLGYWNTQFHHGVFMQTAITRPAISTFEDHSGVLPVHVTGLFAEGQHTINDAAVPYSFSMGLGPNLSAEEGEEGLEPLDLLHIYRGEHKLVTTFRLGYRPDTTAATEAGIFINHGLIPSNLTSAHEIRQNIGGVYANWEQGGVRLIGEIYAVHNTLKGADTTSTGGFISGDLQAEYTLVVDWTLYGRMENAFGDDNDPYLANFPDFMRQRNLAGARVELDEHQALKIELANIQIQDERFNQIALQWSAVFP